MKKLSTLTLGLLFAAGSAFAQSNDATVGQTGNDNDATVEQTNAGSNSATVTQDGDENRVDLTQRNYGASGSAGHEATISQDGDRNEADILSQGGVGVNTVSLEQIGTGNYSQIDQFWGSNDAAVTQDGSDNDVLISHRGTFDSEASVTQIGSENDADILDGGQGTGPNTGTSSSIYQSGDNNIATITQFADDNSASSWVSGNDNEVLQTQSSADNGQRVEITGDNNVYTVDQEVGSGNRLYVNSRGTGPGDNSSYAYDSDFTATQSGSNNLVSGSMGGTNNSLTITQMGDNNMVSGGLGLWDAAGFTIEGSNNVAVIDQQSNGNSAVLSTMGDGNTATITQN